MDMEEEMNVIKRINNNVVLVNDRGKKVIITGKGVGFKVYPGDAVNVDFIEERFVLEENRNEDYYVQLLKEIPMEYLNASQKIVRMAEKELKSPLPTNLVFTLADHFCFAARRFKEGMVFDHFLSWEIKQFYPREYRVGLKALGILKDVTGQQLPEGEAVSVAMHMVNSMGGLSAGYDIVDLTTAMAEIVKKMEQFLEMKIVQESADFTRFVTHLKYYLIRKINFEMDNSMNEELLELVKKEYPKAHQCARMIADYVDERYEHDTSESEMLYLTLHINRLIAGKKHVQA